MFSLIFRPKVVRSIVQLKETFRKGNFVITEMKTPLRIFDWTAQLECYKVETSLLKGKIYFQYLKGGKKSNWIIVAEFCFNRYKFSIRDNYYWNKFRGIAHIPKFKKPKRNWFVTSILIAFFSLILAFVSYPIFIK